MDETPKRLPMEDRELLELTLAEAERAQPGRLADARKSARRSLPVGCLMVSWMLFLISLPVIAFIGFYLFMAQGAH